MAKKKYFGIRKGEDPITKQPVFNQVIEGPWDFVRLYVQGVSGAEYRGFATMEEAEAYVSANQSEKTTSTVTDSNTSATHHPDVLYCYVDGSYKEDLQNYGYGLICVKNGSIVHIDRGLGNNPQAVEMRQIGGELLGAIKSLIFAKNHQEKEVVIYHDYMGVRNHATGEWDRKTEFSKIYYQWLQNFFEKHPEIKVDFQKVDAHTGDDFNEIADGLAKLAVGIKPNPIFYRMVDKHGIGGLLNQ